MRFVQKLNYILFSASLNHYCVNYININIQMLKMNIFFTIQPNKWVFWQGILVTQMVKTFGKYTIVENNNIKKLILLSFSFFLTHFFNIISFKLLMCISIFAFQKCAFLSSYLQGFKTIDIFKLLMFV